MIRKQRRSLNRLAPALCFGGSGPRATLRTESSLAQPKAAAGQFRDRPSLLGIAATRG